MRNITDRGFVAWHAQGIDMRARSAAARAAMACRVQNVVRKLDRHRPWAMKDPRTLFFAQDWLAQARRAF